MTGILIWSLALAFAAVPGWAVARMARGRGWLVRGFVFSGTAVFFLPVAIVLAALAMLSVLGIDVLD